MLSLSLSACGTKKAGVPRADIVVPVRPPVHPVEVVECRDQVCPPATAFCMSINDFKKLQINVNNTEIYLEQLLNLLNSLQKKINRGTK